METRLSRILQSLFILVSRRGPKESSQQDIGRLVPSGMNGFPAWIVFREQLAHGIFYLFIGFLVGNLFGTFLPLIRSFLPWDGFIVLLIIFFTEFISYSRYQNSTRFFFFLWKYPLVRKKSIDLNKVTPIAFLKLSKRWNYFKIGFLLGFFIDAYKVGS